LARLLRPVAFFFPVSFYELPLCVPTLVRGSGSYRGVLRTGVVFVGLRFALGLPFCRSTKKMPIGQFSRGRVAARVGACFAEVSVWCGAA
jgi:hypothetical protein